MSYEQQLFNYINALGPVMSYNKNLVIIDNTGEYGKQKGEKHYIVFVKGGLKFDISKELDDSVKEVQKWIYFVNVDWEGALNTTNAQEIIALLTALGQGDNLKKAQELAAANG